MLLYALGWYTPVFRVFYEVLPGVSLYRRPADAVFLIGALGALLAGYVAHRIFTWSLPPAKDWQRVARGRYRRRHCYPRDALGDSFSSA